MEFDIRNEGSLVLFTPLDDAAKEWWEENVESAPWRGLPVLKSGSFPPPIFCL